MGHIIVLLLVALSAIFSGMTLGSFTLSKSELKRKKELGDKRAAKIYEVRKDSNLLLCTLLVGNVAVNSILSIFLGSITSGVVAGTVSISLIVVFGEILPQAMFSRYVLEFGSKFVWLVKIFIFILYPIAKPLAMALDVVIGEELPDFYSKKELEKIIEQQGDGDNDAAEIDADETRIMKGVLSYSDKTAEEIMTPRSEMVLVNFNEGLKKDDINAIKSSGHSRIPVYKDSADNIVSMLYVKDLIGHDLNGKVVGDMARDNVIFIKYDKKLDDLLNDFKRTRNHLFLVVDDFGSVIGLVTIEDVVEEIIGEEIVDEFDKYEDLQERAIMRNSKKKII